jgi:hypothetical protein
MSTSVAKIRFLLKPRGKVQERGALKYSQRSIGKKKYKKNEGIKKKCTFARFLYEIN